MIKSTKVVTAAIFAVTLIITSCNSNKSKSTDDKSDESVSKTEVKAPAMDIHTATFMGNIQAVNQHIAAGTDLNIKDDYGSTPLNTAIVFGRTDVALALIEGGADHSVTNNEGSTPLHNAAFFCRTDLVKALLDKGADKSLRNNYGSTPLETVSGPFKDVKAIYEQLNKDLGPLGLKLDLDLLESTRPEIADLLR